MGMGVKLQEVVAGAYKKFLEIGEQSSGTLKQYIFLRNLAAEDRGVYSELVMGKHLIPYVYTPAIAEAIQNFHVIKPALYRDTLPLVVDYEEAGPRVKEKIKKVFADYAEQIYKFYHPLEEREAKFDRFRDKLLVVLTDGGRILGIGDQGRDGAEVSFGKINCYSLGSALSPSQLIPMGIDVGTDNPAKRDSPFYSGLRMEKLGDREYYRFLGLVLEALDEMGVAMLQFEDLKKQRAWGSYQLARERLSRVAVFNDDTQGTGAVAVAGLLAAEKSGFSLKDSRFLLAGAGGAGIGIAQQLKWLLEEMDSYSPQKLLLADSRGLAYEGRRLNTGEQEEEFYDFQREYLLRGSGLERLCDYMHSVEGGWELGEGVKLKYAISCFRPNVLIGTTTQPAQFTPELIERVRKHTSKTIVAFGMSNPTHRCEFLTLEQSRRWLDATPEKRRELLREVLVDIFSAGGDIIIATGSPFPEFEFEGKPTGWGR